MPSDTAGPILTAEQQPGYSAPYRVRRMEPNDISAVMALDRLAFSDPWPESAYVQEIYFNPLARYFVLELLPSQPHWRRPWKPRTSNLIGFVGMRVEQTRGHISTLAIHPDWRGLGFGELLLITALQQAVKMKAVTVMLEVRPSNTIAQNLYTKYHFLPIGRHAHYYQDGEDAQLLEVPQLDVSYVQQLTQRQQLLESRIRERLTQAQASFTSP